MSVRLLICILSLPLVALSFMASADEISCPAPGGGLEQVIRTLDPQCIDLQVGDNKFINFSGQESPTLVRHRYELKRVTSKEYQVIIPITLVHNNQAKIKALYEKIDKCLSLVNPYFLGPDSQKLSLSVQPNQSKTVNLDSNIITIRENFKELSSAEFTSEMECPAVVHELLHLVGLVDEYPEKREGYIRNPDGTLRTVGNGENFETALFNCRSIGPESSIMHSANEAFRIMQGIQRGNVHLCEMKASSTQECKKLLKLWNGDSANCPAGTVIRRDKYETPFDKEHKDSRSNEFSAKEKSCKLLNFSTMKSAGLLLPAQFSSIIHPGCQKYNSTYYKCGSLAYKSDTGNPHDSEYGCSKGQIPAECENPDVWLMKVGAVH